MCGLLTTPSWVPLETLLEEVLSLPKGSNYFVVASRRKSTPFLGCCSFAGVRHSGSGERESSERNWASRPRDAVSIVRKLGRLETALPLHDRLLGVCGSATRGGCSNLQAAFPRIRKSTFTVPTAKQFFDDVKGVVGVGVASPTHP